MHIVSARGPAKKLSNIQRRRPIRALSKSHRVPQTTSEFLHFNAEQTPGHRRSFADLHGLYEPSENVAQQKGETASTERLKRSHAREGSSSSSPIAGKAKAVLVPALPIASMQLSMPLVCTDRRRPGNLAPVKFCRSAKIAVSMPIAPMSARAKANNKRISPRRRRRKPELSGAKDNDMAFWAKKFPSMSRVLVRGRAGQAFWLGKAPIMSSGIWISVVLDHDHGLGQRVWIAASYRDDGFGRPTRSCSPADLLVMFPSGTDLSKACLANVSCVSVEQRGDHTRTTMRFSPTLARVALKIQVVFRRFQARHRASLIAQRRYTLADAFKDADERALKCPKRLMLERCDNQLDRLAWYLGSHIHLKDNIQRARCIFRWVCARIKFGLPDFDLDEFRDLNLGLKNLSSPSVVIRSGFADSEGFATLFMELCNRSGIPCFKIIGWAKGLGYRNGDSIDPSQPNHTWNAVQIHGHWHLVDTIWSAGESCGGYVHAFREGFFLTTSSAVFVWTHFPERAVGPQDLIREFQDKDAQQALQFLLEPISFEEFEARPSLSSVAGELNVRIHQPLRPVVVSNTPNAKIAFNARGGMVVRALMAYINSDGHCEEVSDGDRFVHVVERKEAGDLAEKICIRLAFPHRGQYLVTVQGKVADLACLQFETIVRYRFEVRRGLWDIPKEWLSSSRLSMSVGMLWKIYSPRRQRHYERKFELMHPSGGRFVAGETLNFEIRAPPEVEGMLVASNGSIFHLHRGGYETFCGRVKVENTCMLSVFYRLGISNPASRRLERLYRPEMMAGSLEDSYHVIYTNTMSSDMPLIIDNALHGVVDQDGRKISFAVKARLEVLNLRLMASSSSMRIRLCSEFEVQARMFACRQNRNLPLPRSLVNIEHLNGSKPAANSLFSYSLRFRWPDQLQDSLFLVQLASRHPVKQPTWEIICNYWVKRRILPHATAAE